MSGIIVVVALVRCAANLLHCDDLGTAALRFANVDECNRRLPAIISEFQEASAPSDVVMGRCRFQVSKPIDRPSSHPFNLN